MSLQKFIEFVNSEGGEQYSSTTPSVAELVLVAQRLQAATRCRGLVAHERGPSLLQHVSMLERARLELEKLGIPVNV